MDLFKISINYFKNKKNAFKLYINKWINLNKIRIFQKLTIKNVNNF